MSQSKDPDLIVYGGAFDPPHQGHVDCLKAAGDRFPRAEFWVVPARQPAGAAGQHKTPSLSFADRMSLCEVAFAKNADLAGLKLHVDPIESQLGSPNFTVKTLQEIQANNADARLGLLLGQDQLAAFPHWNAPEDILRSADLIMCKRDGLEGPQDLKSTVEQMVAQLSLAVVSEGEDRVLTHLGRRIFWLDRSMSAARSSVIRDVLTAGRSLPSGWLPRGLLDYIGARGFYRPSKTNL